MTGAPTTEGDAGAGYSSEIDVVETVRAKRDGEVLSTAAIDALIASIGAPHGVSDPQLVAFAMAVLLRGMNARECADLTRSMTHSGTVMDWSAEGLPGPCIDQHSTGGVGDKVSLLLAPMLAALGHTGGTLDKLESIPGYRNCVVSCANVAAQSWVPTRSLRLPMHGSMPSAMLRRRSSRLRS